MRSSGSSHRRGDPGLQPERTTLAWTRTCLSYAGCSLLCAKLVADAALLAACVGLVGTAAAMVVLGVALRRYRDEPGAPAHRSPTPVVPPPRAAAAVPAGLMVGLTALTVGLGGAAMVLVVIGG